MTRLNGSRGNGRQLATTLIIRYPAIRRGYNIFCFDKFASPCLAWSVEISPRRSKEEKNLLNESKMLENRKRLYRSVERMIAYFFYSRVARNRVTAYCRTEHKKGKTFHVLKKILVLRTQRQSTKNSHARSPYRFFTSHHPSTSFPLSLSLSFSLFTLACFSARLPVVRLKEE